MTTKTVTLDESDLPALIAASEQLEARITILEKLAAKYPASYYPRKLDANVEHRNRLEALIKELS